jgi:hypothetical protein
MLDDILQGFLGDSEEAEGDILRKLPGNSTMDKLNLQVVLIGELPAERSDGWHETQNVQPRGMKLLRDGVEAGRNFRGYGGDAAELFAGTRRNAGNFLLKLAEADLEEGHALSQIVV